MTTTYLPKASAQHLHCLVYFVADKPTDSNISQSIPLVGTKSYKTFLSWCADMNVDVTRIRLFNQITDPFNGFAAQSLNTAIDAGHIKVVALGQAASEYLDLRTIGHYNLPHPSGANRKLNSKEELKETLNKCREFIYEDFHK